LRHRIILSPEKEMEGISADEIIKQIIDKVEVPR
jgi:MoxR-like ATPase